MKRSINYLAAVFAFVFLAGPLFAESYQDMSAAEKFDVIWSSIEESRYDSYPHFTGLELLPLLDLALPWNKDKATEYMNVTVTRDEDMLPIGRKKIVHTYGSVAGVTFIASDETPFSGLFKGARYGIVRLSLAVKPNVVILPGAAFKFFVDGKPSKNFMAMNSLTGQLSYNFFEKEFSNVLPDMSGPLFAPLKNVFGAVTKSPNKVSVAHLAGVNENGTFLYPEETRSPSKIVLSPNPELQFPKYPHEIREDFEKIPVGTLLYNVYSEQDGKRNFIGKILTTTPFIASEFGDKKLFFNHKRVDE
ncbi:MAG: hypothetical protein HQK54_09070 [Oligoflexales bacterium]|nr:hypothetical protein [Oligoflexales bacterium]